MAQKWNLLSENLLAPLKITTHIKFTIQYTIYHMYVYPSLDPKFHQIQKMLMYRVRTTLMYDCVTRNNDTKII